MNFGFKNCIISFMNIQKKNEKIIIPTLGAIDIAVGTVPSSGATVSIQEINKAFEKAAKENIIPPPPDQNTTT